MLFRLFFGLALALAWANAACARDYKIGRLTISDPWTRATPGGSQVAVGYLRIRNDGKTADRLIRASSNVARTIDVHQMSMSHGMDEMRSIPNGLAIPPGAAVTLKPGSFHLMFQHIKQPFKKGQTIKVTLRFKKAGSIPVAFTVESIGATHFQAPQ